MTARMSTADGLAAKLSTRTNRETGIKVFFLDLAFDPRAFSVEVDSWQNPVLSILRAGAIVMVLRELCHGRILNAQSVDCHVPQPDCTGPEFRQQGRWH